jgi:protein SCO1/2
MMNKSLFIGACLLSLMLAACNPSGAPNSESAPNSEQPPLAGAAIGGPFTLTGMDGQPVSDSDFAGQYRIIYFGYSYCPDVCPVDLQKLMQGLLLAEKVDPALAQKIQPIFITIDPARDTPAQLKTYVANFHPRLIGLTGTEEQIADAAKKYLILYQKQENSGMSEYLMDHSRQGYLFGPKGEPLALLPYDGTPQQVADEIARWVK